MLVEGYHSTYGRVMLDEDELATAHPMIEVRLVNGLDLFAKQGQKLTVGKVALKDQGGYVKKKRERNSLAEMYIPLANSIAARAWRAHNNQTDYEELQCVAYMGLCDAANRFEGDAPLFATYARIKIEGEIQMHWRTLSKYNMEQSHDDFDEFSAITTTSNLEELDRVERLVRGLRPRLRDIMLDMYYNLEPKTANEVAYKLGISFQRVSQLKQEAIGILRETLKKVP
jgi:RNA polymerase sigma factor (sigma-70 family)